MAEDRLTKEEVEWVSAAQEPLDAYFDALNNHDERGINDAMAFPHMRIGGGGDAEVLERHGDYRFASFADRTRAEGWHHSRWDYRTPISVGPDKVHFDCRFTRYREDGSVIAHHRAIYIVTRQDGRWGIRCRSSFAA